MRDMGAKGGRIGGKRRLETMTDAQRTRIAKKAANARWSKANPNLKGDQAVHAIAENTWDSSVKSLVAFPQILMMMDEKLNWMERLGDAFLAQQQEVMTPVISISNLTKSYASGLQALKGINLEINKGEIFALLGWE